MERLQPVLQSLALRYDQPQHMNMLEVADETPGESGEGDERAAAIVLPLGCSDMEYKYRQVCIHSVSPLSFASIIVCTQLINLMISFIHN